MYCNLAFPALYRTGICSDMIFPGKCKYLIALASFAVRVKRIGDFGVKHSGLPTHITVREGTVAEREAIAKLTKAAYSEYASESDPEFWARYETSTESTLLTDDSVLRLVADVGGTIAATVLLCPPYDVKFGEKRVQNPYPEMRLLAVSPAHRKFGLGALLIDECEKRVRESGSESITLHTTILMKTAKAMYERRGYERYTQIDFEPVPGFVVWGYKKNF